MDHHNKFSAYAASERDSFLAYRETYVLMYPPPEKPVLESDSQLIQWGLTAIVIASMIASAVHTIPKFLEGVDAPTWIGWFVGASTFVMVELAIIIFAYTITRRRYMYDKTVRQDKVGWHMYAALALSVAVAIFVNVYATVENAVAFTIPIWAEVVMTILIGLCPPAMAFISGDILAQRWVEDQRAKYRNETEFKRVQAEYEEKCRRSWRATSSKEHSAYSLNSVNVQVNGMNRPSANGNSKVLTLDYLEKHPDAKDLTVDELKEAVEEWSGYEVGRTNVYHAQREFKQRTLEENQ